MTIALFVAHAVNVFDALLRGGKGSLLHYPEITLQLWGFFKKLLELEFADADNLGIFNSLNIIAGWFAALQAAMITHPPVFNRKLGYLFVEFFVDEIQAQATFAYKI